MSFKNVSALNNPLLSTKCCHTTLPKKIGYFAGRRLINKKSWTLSGVNWIPCDGSAFSESRNETFLGPIASLAARSKSHFVKGQEIEIDSPECWLRAPGASILSLHRNCFQDSYQISTLNCPTVRIHIEIPERSPWSHHDHLSESRAWWQTFLHRTFWSRPLLNHNAPTLDSKGQSHPWGGKKYAILQSYLEIFVTFDVNIISGTQYQYPKSCSSRVVVDASLCPSSVLSRCAQFVLCEMQKALHLVLGWWTITNIIRWSRLESCPNNRF